MWPALASPGNTRTIQWPWPTPHFCNYVFLQIVAPVMSATPFPGLGRSLKEWIVCEYGLIGTVAFLYSHGYWRQTSGDWASWAKINRESLHRPKTKTQRTSSTAANTHFQKIVSHERHQPNRKINGHLWNLTNSKRSLCHLTNCLAKKKLLRVAFGNFVQSESLFGILLE